MCADVPGDDKDTEPRLTEELRFVCDVADALIIALQSKRDADRDKKRMIVEWHAAVLRRFGSGRLHEGAKFLLRCGIKDAEIVELAQ